MGSLREKPYEDKTLTNIAMAHIKLKDWAEALEFSERAIYMDPKHVNSVKPRSKRVVALQALGRLDDALAEAKAALALDPENEDVAKQLREIAAEVEDRDVELAVQKEAKDKSKNTVEKFEKKAAQQAKAANASVAAPAAPEAPTPTPPAAPATVEDKAMNFVPVSVDIEDDDEEEENKEENKQQPPLSKAPDSSKDAIKASNKSKGSSGPAKKNKKGKKEKKTGANPAAMPAANPGLGELADLMGMPGMAGGAGMNMDGIETGLQNMMANLPSQYSLLDKIVSDLRAGQEKMKTGMPILEALAMILMESRESRVYFRTGPGKGLHYLCSRLCGGGQGAPPPEAGAVTAAPDGGGFDLDEAPTLEEQPEAALAEADPTPYLTLTALSAAVHGERKSKRIVLDHGALEAAGRFLSPPTAPEAGASEESKTTKASESLNLRVAAARLLRECMDDELEGEQAARAVAKDPLIMAGLLSLLPSSPTSSTNPLAFDLAASILRDTAIDTTCRRILLRLSGRCEDPAAASKKTQRIVPVSSSDLDPIQRLTQALAVTQSKAQDFSEGREAAAGALANLALSEDFRPLFAAPQGDQGEEMNGSKVSTATALLRVVQGGGETAAARAFALAALMNSCLEDSGAVKQSLIDAKAVPCLLAALSNGTLLAPIRVRAAGLLSRLATDATAAGSLRQLKAVEQLTQALKLNARGGEGEDVKWVEEERDHLVRLLALLVSSHASQAAEALAGTSKTKAGMQDTELLEYLRLEGILDALVSFLPPATADGRGDVTASSVVQPVPEDKKVHFKLSGNVVKCFIPVMTDPSSAAAEQLFRAGLLDRLISLLANTKEIPVRKNVAIVLAKAMRNPTANTRVRDLRGMEMLMQLGPQIA